MQGAVSQGVKTRSPVGINVLVFVQGAVSQGAKPRSLVGLNVLVLVRGAVSREVKPRSPSIFGQEHHRTELRAPLIHRPQVRTAAASTGCCLHTRFGTRKCVPGARYLLFM